MDTERVERVLIEYMASAESSSTEGGHMKTLAAAMAKKVIEVSTMKAGPARASLFQGMVIVRVPMISAPGTPRRRRMITAGLDAFQQLVSEVLIDIPGPLISGALAALRPVLADQVARISSEVAASAEAVTSDTAQVARWKAEMARKRDLKVKRERENLVSGMLGLLADGWTRDMLLDALDSATCRSVMHG